MVRLIIGHNRMLALKQQQSHASRGLDAYNFLIFNAITKR